VTAAPGVIAANVELHTFHVNVFAPAKYTKLSPPTAPQPVTDFVLVVGVGDTIADVANNPVIVVAVSDVQVLAEIVVVPVVIWILEILVAPVTEIRDPLESVPTKAALISGV
jgi:hypothetical protein